MHRGQFTFSTCRSVEPWSSSARPCHPQRLTVPIFDAQCQIVRGGSWYWTTRTSTLCLRSIAA